MATSRVEIQSEKHFRLVGRWARFADPRFLDYRPGLPTITNPQFPDYIPQRMRGMAMNSSPQTRFN